MQNPERIQIDALDSQVDHTPSFIPKSTHQSMIIGSIGAGKTTLLINMFLSPAGFKGRFNKIIWCSPTVFSDEKVRKYLCNPKQKIIVPNKDLIRELIKQEKKSNCRIGSNEHTMDIAMLLENSKPRCLNESDFTETIDFYIPLMESQRKVMERFGKQLADEVLVIIDDCASNRRVFNRDDILKACITARHYKITTYYLTQCYYNIPKSIRLQCASKILFNCPNVEELKDIYRENSADIDLNKFVQIFRKVHSKEHRFVGINLLNPFKQKLSDCFDQIINVDCCESY